MNSTSYNSIDLSAYQTLFLDRDGVINRLRPNDYVKDWKEFEFLPGILEAIARWSKQCKYIIVITNQRGVGRGLMTENALLNINKRMISEIEKHDGRVDKIYYCIDVNEDSPNRKPNIGMALQAKTDFPDINFSKTVMIGDSNSDMIFGERLGIEFIYINFN